MSTIVERWTMLVGMLAEGTYPEEVGSWFHRAWIPLAEEGAADALVIDADTGPGYGRIGTLVHDGETYFGSFRCYAEFLAATAEALENGTGIPSTRADVDEHGYLAWRTPGVNVLRPGLRRRESRT